MSEWIFQTDAYLRAFQAHVTAIQDNIIALDQTAELAGTECSQRWRRDLA